MDDEQKIQLADMIVGVMKSYLTAEDMPIMVGTLISPQGIKGFDAAEIGSPVFEYKDRYIVYLKNSLTTVAIPYYKESLSPVINFL